MTKSERTDRLLARFRGNPHEFYMLKGILCMDQGYCGGDLSYEQFQKEYKEYKKIQSVFDMQRIAKRMDELNGIDVAA